MKNIEQFEKSLKDLVSEISSIESVYAQLKHQRDIAMILVERVLFRIEKQGCKHFFDKDVLEQQLKQLKKEVGKSSLSL